MLQVLGAMTKGQSPQVGEEKDQRSAAPQLGEGCGQRSADLVSSYLHPPPCLLCQPPSVIVKNNFACLVPLLALGSSALCPRAPWGSPHISHPPAGPETAARGAPGVVQWGWGAWGSSPLQAAEGPKAPNPDSNFFFYQDRFLPMGDGLQGTQSCPAASCGSGEQQRPVPCLRGPRRVGGEEERARCRRDAPSLCAAGTAQGEARENISEAVGPQTPPTPSKTTAPRPRRAPRGRGCRRSVQMCRESPSTKS